MAKFCSECGESTTELMRRCPRCGATLMQSSNDGGTLVRCGVMLLGLFIAISTFMSWYTIHLSIDGGVVDILVRSVSRFIPGYSGIATTSGIVIFVLAIAMIVGALCRSRYTVFWASLFCVIVAMCTVVNPPSVEDLLGADSVSTSHNLMENLDGALKGVSPLGSAKVESMQIYYEVATEYMSVELCHGIKIMLILSCAALALAIYDISRVRYSTILKK